MQQVDELVDILGSRHDPIIIMGDFNSEWLVEQYLVQSLTESSNLHVYEPASQDLHTYKNNRFDWILLSGNLKFASYYNEEQMFSDHKAVIADIKWKINK